MTRVISLFAFLAICIAISPVSAQKVSDSEIRSRIEAYKADPRGPYKEIRWFCKDGSVLPAKEPCPEPGGVQRASYKDEVKALAKSNHIFLGQILATTEFDDFWDAEYHHSRLIQYQLEDFLKNIDDGWVNRKAQFYRGAFQVEDEISWGRDFLQWLLAKEEVLSSKFFLVRQAVKTIPHHAETDRSVRIRSLSKVIADNYSPFMGLRTKIHGQPEAADLDAVRTFAADHRKKMAKADQEKLTELIKDMEEFYKPVDAEKLMVSLRAIPKDSDIYKELEQYIENFAAQQSPAEIAKSSAASLLSIRKAILSMDSRRAKLALFDLSIALEKIFYKSIAEWQSDEPEVLMDMIFAAGQAATGTGFVEIWEWEATAPRLTLRPDQNDQAAQEEFLDAARRLVEWAVGTVRANYGATIELYQSFEPKAYGFQDHIVRESGLLHLGSVVGDLGTLVIKERANRLMDLKNTSQARGLNPGKAMAELVVIDEAAEEMELDKNKIYVFKRPPHDLKPIAGIATVTEGNLVSHVQLLARNLSIPNAVVSDQNLESLKKYSGTEVYYEVTADGRVIMKPADEMSESEKGLFVKQERNLSKVEVPIDKIQLNRREVIDMREVDSGASGVICGPKAANLGQLKAMFPDKVVEGLVIPFGIFKMHMDQQIPGRSITYWSFLTETFQAAVSLEENGAGEANIESFLLAKLDTLRNEITRMPLLPEFISDLKHEFLEVFGKQIGEVPVFLRSDTNMEDLEDFTGAGLNLTLFNIVAEDQILNGIKKVWASPYTERSFKWRQRFLLNPENVFPSILIIPSVDVDFSGVLITKGVSSGEDEDLTLAISRGAGGAVDGQAAESYLLKADGSDILLTPAREPSYRRLPVTGGTSSHTATFERAIINKAQLDSLRAFALTVEKIFPKATGTTAAPAYDIEFGFKDNQLWLFQIRPFVEGSTAEEDDPVSGPLAPEDSNWLWYLTIGVLLVLAGFIAYRKFKKPPKQDTLAQN